MGSGFGDDAGNVNLTRDQPDHKENVVTNQAQSGPYFDAEEVGRGQYFPVRPQKLFPSGSFLPFWSRIYAGLLQHLGNRATADFVTQVLQRALKACVTPRTILSSHP